MSGVFGLQIERPKRTWSSWLVAAVFATEAVIWTASVLPLLFGGIGAMMMASENDLDACAVSSLVLTVPSAMLFLMMFANVVVGYFTLVFVEFDAVKILMERSLHVAVWAGFPILAAYFLDSLCGA